MFIIEYFRNNSWHPAQHEMFDTGMASCTVFLTKQEAKKFLEDLQRNEPDNQYRFRQIWEQYL